jgi:RNA polymerase sigma-70 factor, ECF subfamily
MAQIYLEPDQKLISRFQHGELSAFDRLMDAYTDKVYSLAWGVLYNREEALDAVQEVFVKLYKALPKFDPSDNLNAWIYRVCLNHCIDRKRSKKRLILELTEDDWERLSGDYRDDPQFAVCQKETGKIIMKAVDRLPKRQRMAFILRHYKLLTINEVAEVLGCTSGAVKAHLSRATFRLRNELKIDLDGSRGDY